MTTQYGAILTPRTDSVSYVPYQQQHSGVVDIPGHALPEFCRNPLAPVTVGDLLLNTLHSGHFGQQCIVTVFPVFSFLVVYLVELRSKGLCIANVIPGVV